MNDVVYSLDTEEGRVHDVRRRSWYREVELLVWRWQDLRLGRPSSSFSHSDRRLQRLVKRRYVQSLRLHVVQGLQRDWWDSGKVEHRREAHVLGRRNERWLGHLWNCDLRRVLRRFWDRNQLV